MASTRPEARSAHPTSQAGSLIGHALLWIGPALAFLLAVLR
ncbi:hypothetical protein ABFT23_05250 [Nocardioides sp. C4-1]